jgi:hypothetical protein
MNKRTNIFIINPHHYCYSTAALIEGLSKIDNVKVFSNSFQNYATSVASQLKSQLQLAKASDIVVLAHSALEPKYNEVIGPLINEVKVDVFLDGSDHRQYSDDPSKYKVYLKRELDPTQLKHYDNVVPFEFAVEDRFFINGRNRSHLNMWRNKKLDLVCMMGIGECPWRVDIMEDLKKKYGEIPSRFFIGPYHEDPENQKVDTEGRHNVGYFQKLQNSRISVAAYGAGECRQTGRFWESLAAGCLIFYQPVDPFVWHTPYVDGEHIVVYNNNDELLDKADYYMNHEDQAEKIARNSYELMLRSGQTLNRGQEFLSLIEEYL